MTAAKKPELDPRTLRALADEAEADEQRFAEFASRCFTISEDPKRIADAQRDREAFRRRASWYRERRIALRARATRIERRAGR